MPAMCVCVSCHWAWWQVVTLPGCVENLRINVQLLEIDKHAIDIDVFLLNRIACRVQCERFFLLIRVCLASATGILPIGKMPIKDILG